MSIILFAIIGATINPGLPYWLIWALYGCAKVAIFWYKFFSFVDDDDD